MIIQCEPRNDMVACWNQTYLRKTDIYYIKILWLFSKNIPVYAFQAILYDIVINNCEQI